MKKEALWLREREWFHCKCNELSWFQVKQTTVNSQPRSQGNFLPSDIWTYYIVENHAIQSIFSLYDVILHD